MQKTVKSLTPAVVFTCVRMLDKPVMDYTQICSYSKMQYCATKELSREQVIKWCDKNVFKECPQFSEVYVLVTSSVDPTCANYPFFPSKTYKQQLWHCFKSQDCTDVVCVASESFVAVAVPGNGEVYVEPIKGSFKCQRVLLEQLATETRHQLSGLLSARNSELLAPEVEYIRQFVVKYASYKK